MINQCERNDNKISVLHIEEHDASLETQNRPISSTSHNSCVISGAFAYILMLTSIFGMAPVRYESHELGFRISVSKPMRIYSYLLVFCTCSSAVLGDVYKILESDNIRSYDKLMLFFHLYLKLITSLIAILSVINGPKRMKNLISYMNTIATVDRILGSQYSRVTDLKIIVTVMSMYIISIGLAIYTYHNFNECGSYSTITLIASQVQLHIVMNLYLQLNYIVKAVNARFQSINDALTLVTCQWSTELENVVPEPVNICAILEVDSALDRAPAIIVRRCSISYPQLVVSPTAALKNITFLRGKLCDIVNSVSNDCGPSIIMSLLAMLFNFVAAVHNATTVYSSISEDPLLTVSRLSYVSFWLVFHTALMILLLNPCHDTIQKDNKTRRIVCRMMSSVSPSSMMFGLLEMVGHLVMLKPASYEPLSMFTLNRRLMVKIVGAISTYVVILEQL